MATALSDVGFRFSDIGLLYSALSRARARLFGTDVYPDPFIKGAAITHSMITAPAMVDGNKRCAWITLLAFMGQNDYVIKATEDEAFDFVVGISAGLLQLGQIASWIRAHSKPFDV